ncbi:membrane protein [Saccharomonospora iraqiensis]|uniref:membrane protein n=1 Tax=Saccharomonospora iraqiensis TaxID=52698 RepID=UPI0004099917|nr:membrane protein [Saccharomonospora iraqiensis]
MTVLRTPAPPLVAPEPPSPSKGARRGERWRNRLTRSALPAVAAYLAVRMVGVGVLGIWGASESRGLVELLGTLHDSAWYVRIIENGYDGGEPAQSDMVFFPLYPVLARALSGVTTLGSVGAALVLAWVAGLVAAWGLYTLGSHLHDRRTGIVLAVLWGVLPHAVVESMAYTESLFTALAVWGLYTVLTGRWLSAGWLCLLAGLTRPTATALIAVVCLAALVAVVRRPAGWRPWVALFLAPAGWLGYLAWVGYQVGRPDAWFRIEEHGWNTSWDGGGYTLSFALDVLGEPSALDFYVVTLILVVAVALFAHSLLQRQPWPLLLYSGVLLLTTLGGSGMYNAKARFLLVAVPLLLPVAIALARTRTAAAVVTLTVLTAISAYFGGYLLLVWEWSP